PEPFWINREPISSSAVEICFSIREKTRYVCNALSSILQSAKPCFRQHAVAIVHFDAERVQSGYHLGHIRHDGSVLVGELGQIV
ncbi:hypothetical protein CLI75_11900, partial [Porphyromonas gingivalis]